MIDGKIWFLGAIMVIVVGFVAFEYIYEPTHETLIDLNSVSINKSLNEITPAKVSNWIDNTLIFAYFAVNIALCIIIPLRIQFHPIYFGAVFIFTFIYTYILAIISNILVEFMNSYSSSFTATIFILEHIIQFEVVFILIMCIVMFYKRQDSYAIGGFGGGGYY